MSYNKQNPQSIQSLFGSIAKHYDRTNAVLSFKLHKHWNHELIMAMMHHDTPRSLLDLCCGTGEIAFGYLNKMPMRCHAYLLDFCEEMLVCAKQKRNAQGLDHHHVTYLRADAEQIPLPKESVSAATIAYGIRNVKDPCRCMEEVFRTLEPGGSFGILELTTPKNRLLRFGHKAYLRYILPHLGRLLTRNKHAYEYLNQSIQTFINPTELEQYLKRVGFTQTYQKPLSGGIATIVFGRKAC